MSLPQQKIDQIKLAINQTKNGSVVVQIDALAQIGDDALALVNSAVLNNYKLSPSKDRSASVDAFKLAAIIDVPSKPAPKPKAKK